MNVQALGDRMKEYEAASNICLPKNTPIILRVDGRAFHKFCRRFGKPFDMGFIIMMDTVAYHLCKEISSSKMAYVQSDEISVLIYPGIHQSPWFNNNIQKMTSISASVATASAYRQKLPTDDNLKAPTDGNLVNFDSRVFVVPEKDVVNYFVWRQRDWIRNSIQMMARSLYSHKELVGKNQTMMLEMIRAKDKNWEDLPNFLKYGRILHIENDRTKEPTGWHLDRQVPVFTENREYIERHVIADTRDEEEMK